MSHFRKNDGWKVDFLDQYEATKFFIILNYSSKRDWNGISKSVKKFTDAPRVCEKSSFFDFGGEFRERLSHFGGGRQGARALHGQARPPEPLSIH